MVEQEKDILKENQDGLQDVTETESETADTSQSACGQEPDNVNDTEAAEKIDKKFMGKSKKKDKKEEVLKQRVEELEDKVRRQMAEFENFRKRTEKEKTAMFEIGARSVIEKMLPVVDNFERGLESIPEEEKGNAFSEGMNMIYKQLTGELDKMGVKPIEALGTEFDPEFHNAVMQVESEEYGPGIVAKELQKGYTYHDVVIRHSMVMVSE